LNPSQGKGKKKNGSLLNKPIKEEPPSSNRHFINQFSQKAILIQPRGSRQSLFYFSFSSLVPLGMGEMIAYGKER
jgi:hypothetical protein